MAGKSHQPELIPEDDRETLQAENAELKIMNRALIHQLRGSQSPSTNLHSDIGESPSAAAPYLVQAGSQTPLPAPCRVPQYQWRNRKFTCIGIPMARVYRFLLFQRQLVPIPARPLSHPLPHDFRSDLRCAYHSCQQGHEEEGCTALKHKVQDLMDCGAITLEEANPYSDPSARHSEVTLMADSLVPDDFGPEWV